VTVPERESQPDGILPAKAPATEEEDANSSSRGKRLQVTGISSAQLKNQQHQQLSRPSRSEDEEERAWTISPTKAGANHFPFHKPASPLTRRSFASPRMTVPRSPNSFAASALSTSQNDTSASLRTLLTSATLPFLLIRSLGALQKQA
jgi:hypothetical protein